MNRYTMRLLIVSACLAIFTFLQLVSASTMATEVPATWLGSESDVSVNPDSMIERYAQKNIELTQAFSATENELLRLNLERKIADTVSQRILADYSDADATLKEVGRLEDGLGPLLRQHHESLPDAEYYAKRIRQRVRAMAEIGVRRMLQREELRRISDTENAANQILSSLITEDTTFNRQNLLELIRQRVVLLNSALEQGADYLHALKQLDSQERVLLTRIEDYDGFLRQHLWWLRGAEPVVMGGRINFSAALTKASSPASWLAAARLYANQLVRSPIVWLSAIVVGMIIFRRRKLIKAIDTSSQNVGKISTDRMFDTFKVLFWTLILSIPIPLLILVLVWQTDTGNIHNQFGSIPSPTLVYLCVLLFILSAFRWICLPGALAAVHFRWADRDLQRVRLLLKRLIIIFVLLGPSLLLVYSNQRVEELGFFSRVGFFLFHVTVSVTVYALLQRDNGVISSYFQQRGNGLVYRLYPVGFWVLVLLPIWLGIEMLVGYIYSSVAGSRMLLSTFGLGMVLLVIYAMARRWLLVIYRRMAYAAALDRRKTTLAARAAKAMGEEDDANAELVLDEPEVNLTELSEDTRRLINIVILIIGLIGLYFVWMPLFPALRIFDNVDLWYRTVTIGDEIQRIPTTLADIGRALLILIGTVVLVNRLPSVLEIVLLQRSKMTEGDRYTISKLATYSLVAIGSVLTLSTIGASWSQLQWLVAALGVGIGFGLQEIVANFISGLIILFERPIRIGDVVTIDDTSGIVTKIRIRATTIRDWDRKELLVPNKDLITGRVLNWSLSDEMTRVVVTVGVAYNTDVDKAMELVREAADEHENALKDPAPLISFDDFGDHALNLTMRVYVSSISHRIKTVTELRKMIYKKFKAEGIEISYPQRDVHVDIQDPLRVSLDSTASRDTASAKEMASSAGTN